MHQHPPVQPFLPEPFAEPGTLEWRADHLPVVVRCRIHDAGIGPASVFDPHQLRFNIERGQQRAVFAEGLKAITCQHGFQRAAYLMAHVPCRSIHFLQFCSQLTPLHFRTVAQTEFLFQFTAGRHGPAVFVSVTDFPSLIVHAYADDVDVRIVRVAVPEHDVRLAAIAHLFHVLCRQSFQLSVRQRIFRCRTEGDVQDRLLGTPVRQQVVLEGEQRQPQVPARLVRTVGYDAVA